MNGKVEAIVLGAALFALYFAAAAPTIVAGDSGELVAVSASLGVAHPPGYPLYTVLGAVAGRIPCGSVAFRMNLLSAAFAAAACSILYGAIRGLSDSRPAGLTAALLLAGSPLLMSQALIAEVYAMVAFLAVAAAVLLAARGGVRPWLLGAYAAGTGAAHHPMGAWILPVFIPVLFFRGRRYAPKLWAIWIGSFLLPWTIAYYLQIRGAADVPICWGDPSSWEGLVAHLSRSAYGDLLRSDATGLGLGKKLSLSIRMIGGALEPWAIALGAIGLAAAIRDSRRVALAVGIAIVLGVVVLPALLQIEETTTSLTSNRNFFLPVVIIFAALGGWAAKRLGDLTRKRWIAWALVGLALQALVTELPRQSQRGNHAVADLGRIYLESLPSGATLRVYQGQLLMPLLYLQLAEHVREDVRIEEPRGIFRSRAPQGPYLFTSDKVELGDRFVPAVPHGVAWFHRRKAGAATVPEFDWSAADFSLRTIPADRIAANEAPVVMGYYLRVALGLAEAGYFDRARQSALAAGPYAARSDNGKRLVDGVFQQIANLEDRQPPVGGMTR